MSVAIYCRVSSEDQAERGTIENQVIFGQKFCDLHQLDIYKIYKDDGVSGTIPFETRPQGKQLIEDAKNKMFNTMLIFKLDRLGRSTRITLNSIHLIEKLGIQIKSMTEPFDTSTPSGRFAITVLAGVADLERSNILERMWYGANRAAKEGKWLGGIVPYGYVLNDDDRLEINNNIIPSISMSEADVIKLIFDLVVNKNYSTIKVADYLNSLSVPTSYQKDNRKINIHGKRKKATAGVWRPNTVQRIIKNTTYMGIHEYGKRSKKKREIITRKVPSIIDEITWHRAQDVLHGNQIEAMKNAKRPYLLRGLIKCGICGCTYHGSCYKSTGDTLKAFYVCSGKTTKYNGPLLGKCTSKNIPADWIEDMVWNDIIEFINNPGDSVKNLQKNIDVNKDNTTALLNEKKLLKNNYINTDNEKQSILSLYRKGIINDSDVEQQLSQISTEEEKLKSKIKDVENELKNVSQIINFDNAETLIEDMKKKIHTNMTFEEKRNIIKLLVNQVIVDTIPSKIPNGRAKAKITFDYNFVDLFSTRSGIHASD